MRWILPFCLFTLPAAVHAADIEVDAADAVAPLRMFWNASGLNAFTEGMPPDDAPVSRANYFMMGAIPYDGCEWQRPHSLLNYIEGRGIGTDRPDYDWSRFDTVMDLILESGQRPFFEIMGDPGGWNADFSDPDQVQAWRRFVRDLARHLVDRYGAEEVRQWYFETWNEPDKDFDRKDLPWTEESFLAYYDACSAGLHDVDPALRFGGPGTARAFHDLTKLLVRHALKGESSLGPDAPAPKLDFISYHHKTRPNWQVKKAREIHDWLQENAGRYADVPLINNEADTEAGWGDTDKGDHRARPIYAGYIARQVCEFQNRLSAGGHDDIRIANDNAFLGGWLQRTQFVWFGDETSFALIKKPAHNVMTLLALMGDEQIRATRHRGVHLLASRRGSGQVALLLCRYRHKESRPRPAEDLTVRIENLPFEDGLAAAYRIDANHGDIYALWKEIGAPDSPDAEQLKKLRAAQELTKAEQPRPFSGNIYETTLSLPEPGVHLILLSADPGAKPKPPERLKAQRFEGIIEGHDDILLTWQIPGRAVATHEIEWAGSAEGPWVSITAPPLIAGSYTISQPEDRAGSYRIRTVDWWGRSSEWKEVKAPK